MGFVVSGELLFSSTSRNELVNANVMLLWDAE